MHYMVDQLLDPKLLTVVFAAIAAGATVLTLAMPYVVNDTLPKRMKAVAFEREKIRQRERERLASSGGKVTLRQSPKAYMKTIVENFNLSRWVGQEDARTMLLQAGHRGQAPYVTYLFFRMVMPVVALAFTVFYIYVVLNLDEPAMVKIGISIGAAYFGMISPNLFLRNKIQRRQLSIKRAFPDALDLLLICIESGMSIEAAFRKVSEEIGSQSVRARRGAHPDDGGAVLLAGPPAGLRQPLAPHRARGRQIRLPRAAAGRTLRDAARHGDAGDGAGKSRHAHGRGREKGRGAAAEAHRADDSVFPAGPVRGHSRSGRHPGDGAAVTESSA